jgi:transcriptional regulator with XRE-family HTH domain
VTLPAATRDRVRELALRDLSHRDIASELGISHESVRRILAEPVEPVPDLLGALATLADDLDFDPDRSAVVRRAIAALEPDADDDAPEIDPAASPAEAARALLQSLRVAHHRATLAGDARGAGHNARTLAALLVVVERLERASAEADGWIRIPRDAFEAAQKAYRERVAATVARPLTCARCGAALRAEAAGVELAPAPPAGAI